MTIEEIITHTKKRVKSSHHPLIVAVAGGSATGKSSQVLPKLTQAFGEAALLIEQDWYQLGTNFPDKDQSPYRWDDPRNFQINRLASDLRKLRAGETAAAPSFDVVKVASVGERILQPKPVIIVDGIYTLRSELKNITDYSVYVSMPFYGRFLRRLFRMVYDLKVDKPQTAFRHTFGSVLRAHHDFVSQQEKIADCVIRMPYAFADTIKRYNLQPKNQPLPQAASQLWRHNLFSLYGVSKGKTYQMYIVYQEKIYYDFEIATEYQPLLNGINYLEH